jgi:hypothetical protein
MRSAEIVAAMTSPPPTPRLDPEKARRLLALIAEVRTESERAANR